MAIPKNYQRLANSTRTPVPEAKKIGAVDPNEVINVTFTVRRRPGAPELPSQEHWANTPPGERKYLTSEEFTVTTALRPLISI